MLQNLILAPVLGCHRAELTWLGSALQLLTVHLVPGPRELGWASHHLKEGFFWGNAAFLCTAPLPTVDGVGWGLQQPLIWAPPGAKPSKAPLYSPYVMALAVGMC